MFIQPKVILLFSVITLSLHPYLIIYSCFLSILFYMFVIYGVKSIKRSIMNRYFLFALLAVLAMSSVIAAAPWQWSVEIKGVIIM